MEDTQTEEFGFLSTTILASSLLLPNKAPEKLPQVNSVTGLQDAIVQKCIDAKKSGNEKVANYYDLMQSIIRTESNWNPKAFNSKGGGKGANGLFQIRKPMVDDVNRIYNTKYTIKDAYDINKAAEIYRLYYNIQNRYLKHYKPNSVPNIEDISKGYNQGCSYFKGNLDSDHKANAESYWQKIKNRLALRKKKNFSKIDISNKLLELARDKIGIPINKVEIYDNDYGDTEYKFYVDDDPPYVWYFDGKWFTTVKCMNDIQKFIKNMLNLHFPDGVITEESINKDVIVRKNFSERLKIVFGYNEDLNKYFNIFKTEFKSLYDEFAHKYGVNDNFNDLIRFTCTDKLRSGTSSDCIFSKNYVTIRFDLNNSTLKYHVQFKDDFDSYEKYVRYLACHEFIHVLTKCIDENKADENYGHGEFFKKFMNKLRSRYTNSEFWTNGPQSNFTRNFSGTKHFEHWCSYKQNLLDSYNIHNPEEYKKLTNILKLGGKY